ncbi:MAG TPA: DUF5309 family protein, partial [Rhodanobacteraceae bacterium]
MAVPSNTYQTVSAVGVREDLVNAVFNVDPDVTVLQTAMKRTKATNTYHEWLTDTLAAPAVNAHIQGDDATADTITPTSRLGNYTQISAHTAQVAGTNAAVDSAANVAKMGYVLLKKVKELKRDVETALFSNVARVAPTTTVAGVAAGLPSWLKSNIVQGTGGVAPTGNGTNTRTAGTAAALTESMVKSALLSAFQNTGDIPKLAFAYPTQKQEISAFQGNGTRFVEISGKKLNTAFDIYVSDFGEVTIIPSIFQASGTITFIDPKYAKLAYLRPFQRTPLAKTGDSEKVQILQEWTLEMS